MIKIALNGFGRIGKLALRRLFDNDISLEFINDKNVIQIFLRIF